MRKLRPFRFILLPILIWFFYNGLLMHDYGHFRTRTVATNYWSYLAEAFLDGRTDIKECPPYSDCHDLVFFEGKKYLYWAPVPAFVYLPIVAKMGTQTPDLLIASIFGAINIGLFSLFLFYFSKFFRLQIRFLENQIWTLFWGMGTVHFYMSMNGTVWYIAQVLAQSFLLLGFIFLLKNPRNKWNLLWSGLSLALAIYTRNNLIFALLFAFSILIPRYLLPERQHIFEKWKMKIGHLILFISPFLLASLLNLYYNFIRFGDAFENGLNYHKMDPGYQVNFDMHGYFSWKYIVSNFWIEVLKPPKWTNDFPFFDIENGFGFGFLWASPMLIFFIPATFLFFKKGIKNRNLISIQNIFKYQKVSAMLGNYLALFGISIVIFSVMGPGWKQFASRYSLDYQLFLMIPILFFFEKWKSNKWITSLAFILLLLSVYMNYFGARIFYNLDV